MERLNWHMADELSRFSQVHLIAPGGARASGLPQGIGITEVPLSPLPLFLLSAFCSALRISLTWRPGVVLAGSGLTGPIAWIAARLSGARAVAYLHGLDITVPNQIYRYFWLPALRCLDAVIANSRSTRELAQQAGVEPDRIHIVHPGVSIPQSDPSARARFRAAHDLGDQPVLLSVGRLTARKGLREFVREALPLIVAQRPDAVLVIVGEEPAHALYAKSQSAASIQTTADEAGVGKNLRFLGTLFGEALADAYSGAEMHVFPVRQLPNDPEGFGMVAIEAAAHGLATVAYATGGVVDAVAQGESGYLVQPNDASAFSQAVLELIQTPIPKPRIVGFAKKFDWERIGMQLSESLLNH
jgi:phosphatidylinositol alpha-1,6-mannosyltransferase